MLKLSIAIAGQRPYPRQLRSERVTSVGLGLESKTARGLKARSIRVFNRKKWCRAFSPLSVWKRFPWALPKAGMKPGLWPFIAIFELNLFRVLVVCFAAFTARAAELQKFAFEKAEMGVPFHITIFAENESEASVAVDAAFARIEALNAIFSDYEDDSELAKLSQSSGGGNAVKVSEELWTVLSRAQQLAVQTDGAFDVTCGPLTSVWRRARRKKELPSPELIAEMRARVGFQKMRLDEKQRTVELLAPQMRLDLGSIAKGYACDEAMRVLKQRGFPISLIVAGGDTAAGDAPPGRKGWRIEVAALDVEGDAIKRAPVIIEVANVAVSTSGDRFQKLEAGGKRYSHILDPRTGQPLTDHSLVTVIARDGLTAGISTACSVIGPEKGLKLVAEWKAAALFQRQPAEKLEVTESPGWPGWLLKQ